MSSIIYYEDDNGEKPVINFLRSLPTKDTAKAFWEIELLQEFGTDLTMPHVRK